MSKPLETPPAAKKGEDYEDYDLSPPKMRRKQCSFRDAVDRIKRDFKKQLRVEWDSEEKKKVLWFMKKKQDDGTLVEEELPSDIRRILLFLYSRNFKFHVHMGLRTDAVKRMVKKKYRKIMLQVIKCTGDHNLSSDKTFRAHYIRASLTILRYFQQPEAAGFVQNIMSRITYYFRMQKFGSCFLQASCVAMSYLLQTYNINMPPFDASRLIRHHFQDEEFIKYITGNGGDSLEIFKILERHFFTSERANRNPKAVLAKHLRHTLSNNLATQQLQGAPGLVSGFVVPKNFKCSPPSSDLKRRIPTLAHFEDWSEIPASTIPPGFARFTTWNEPAEFIPLDAPSNSESKEKEDSLKKQWEDLLVRSAEEDVQLTDVTASMSADSSSSFAYNDSLGTPGEQSTTNNACVFTFEDEVSDEDDWLQSLDDDDDDDDDSSAWFLDDDHDENHDCDSIASCDDHEPGEGYDIVTRMHAMVLLGYNMVDGVKYWVIQNSWEGPMQILEFSTDYLMQSDACLYFYGKDDDHSLMPENQWSTSTQSYFCPSPIAESSQLERNDCETWV